MNNQKLKDKVAIVTGASSGIGMACAQELARRGAKVVLAARNSQAIEQLAHTIRLNGGQALAVTTDVTVEADCQRMVASCIKQFEKIDILICNAGISMRAAFEDVDLQVIHRLMDVNFWGAVYATKYALPYLLQSKGSVTGVSSVAGLHGLPGRTGYSSSKYAMQGFLDTLRVETLRQGLHVMVAIPGFTASNVRLSALTAKGEQQGETPRNEDKMMTAEEAAYRIVKGIVKRKRNVVMTYEGRLTPLLKLLAPGWLDKQYYNHMKREPDSPIR